MLNDPSEYRGCRSFNTCKISQSDQQQLLPKRNRQPTNQLSLPKLNADSIGVNSEFSSLAPLISAIIMAPPTQIAVPATFEMLLKLRKFTFSDLIDLYIRIICFFPPCLCNLHVSAAYNLYITLQEMPSRRSALESD